nr:hypothetical protein [Cellulomonas sp. SLBN-39]
MSSTSMIVNGKSSLVSMKTRLRRVTGLLAEGRAHGLRAGPTLLTLGGKVHGILHPDAAMAAAWQAAEREDAVLAEPVDELPRDPEDLRSLGRGHLVLGSQHHDPRTVGDVVKHRAHGGLDGCVTHDPVSQRLGA